MDIKETKELLDAVESLTIDAIVAAKDGIGFDDFKVITGNFEKIKNAVDGLSTIPNEMKELDAEEVKYLAAWAVEFGFKAVLALKAPK